MIAGTVAALVAIATFASCWRFAQYRNRCRLPSHRADCCRVGGNHRSIVVRVEPDGIHLPDGLDLRGRTVLLQMTVQTSLLGHMFDPFIEMQELQQVHRQYFERGASGQRYVNLSPLFQHVRCGSVLRAGLHGRWMRWKSEGLLLVFDPPLIDPAAIVVLAPHPDDADLAGFGMYANRQSWVATITAGEKATANLPAGIPSNARARWAASLRVWDSLTVPQMGEVPAARCVNLVYPDGALESMYKDPTRPHALACEEYLPRSTLRSRNDLTAFQEGESGCTWGRLVEELRLLLELAQPDIVVCPHPVLDIHPDHIFTTVALEQVMRNLRGKRPTLFLYVVHARGGSLFPYGPATSLTSVPPGDVVGDIADSIYSHPLDSLTQQAKYFAIEAMHAVRNYPDSEPKTFLRTLRSIGKEVAGYLAGAGLQPGNHLRRAPRPNEMYYVVGAEKLTELVRSLVGIRESSLENLP